jgi:hypothetical protein
MKTTSTLWKTALLLILPAMILTMSAPLARAQGTDEANRAREALERTDEVIATARRAVDESRSQKARLSLDMAEGLQTKAWDSYRTNGYRMAMKLTAEARDEAWHAIALARADMQFEQTHNRVAEETHERLARLRDQMIESGVRDEQAMKLMDQARNLLEKSQMNAQQLRYQLAFNLADNAHDLTVKAEERVRNTRAVKEAAERRLDVLERLIERTGDQAGASGSEHARKQISLAEGQIARSRELLDAGRYREAKIALERTEKTLRNSVRLMPIAPPGDPRSRLEETRRLLERAGEIAAAGGDPPDPATLAAIERARVMIRGAEDALAAGRTAEGSDMLERARATLREAIRAEEGGATRERIMERIGQTEALRDETMNLAEKCPEPGIRQLMERAQERVRLAREHAESGRLEAAAAEIAIARNMYQRIGELCAR